MLCPALCPILLISSCPYRKQAGIMCCWLMRSKRYILRALKASCRGSSVLSSTLNIFLPLLGSSQSVPDTRSREAAQHNHSTKPWFSSTEEFQAFLDSSLRGRQEEGSTLAEERDISRSMKQLGWFGLAKKPSHQMDVRNLQCRVQNSRNKRISLKSIYFK